MRVIFTGSRNWEGFHAQETVTNIFVGLLNFNMSLGQDLTIVHGGCPTGLDAMIDRLARRWQPTTEDVVTVKVEVFAAEWDRYKRAAGPIRNQTMVDRGGDMCLGFIRGDSVGTRHCLALARNAQIPTFQVEWSPEWPDPAVIHERWDKVRRQIAQRHVAEVETLRESGELAEDPEFWESLEQMARGEATIIRNRGDLTFGIES